jgi:hypothetical protein
MQFLEETKRSLTSVVESKAVEELSEPDFVSKAGLVSTHVLAAHV